MSNLKLNFLFLLLPISFLLFLLFFFHPSTSTTLHTHALQFPPSSALPPPPKIAYFISGSDKDGPPIFRLLQAVYHPRNIYLLHLDHLASDEQRKKLAKMVGSVGVFFEAGNVNVVEKGSPVYDEGSSPMALVLHGAAILLRWKGDWDWFVNLDAFDYPLITQDDFLHILSFVPREFNFIEHANNISMEEYQRIMEIIVDPRLYLASKGRMFMGNRKRNLPNSFKLFTGSPHVVLSRKLVEFSILGWDNLPRTLLLYFSNTKLPHRSYFQTLACNSKFSNTVINSNLKVILGNDSNVEEPLHSNPSNLTKMLETGAAFVGKFPANDPVLDMIDSHVLLRKPRMVLPGGWCFGRQSWGRDACWHWGDANILRPGPGAKRFENLLLRLMLDRTLQSNTCD